MFGLLRQGDIYATGRQGKIIITASFEDKMQTVRLPAIESQEKLWDFIENLFEDLLCECFYEKGSSITYSNGNQVVPNGKYSKDTSFSSPSNMLTNLENEPLMGKNKRRISETGSESTSEENFESVPPPTKKHQRPLMTTLSFNASAATAIANDKSKRLSNHQSREGEEVQRKPKIKKSKSLSIDHSKPRGRPPGPKSKDRHSGDGDPKSHKSPKHKNKPHLVLKTSTATSNLVGHERQTQPVSPSKRLPIYHNAHKMFKEHQLQKQHGLVVAAQQQISEINALTNINLPPPTLLPEVPPPTATITSTQAQQKTSCNRNAQITLANHYQDQSLSHLSKHINPVIGSPPNLKSINKAMPVPNLPSDPTDWSVDQVVKHLSFLDPTLAPHVEMFRTHEIDGKALLLLKEEMMMKYMDMKLGPALKISNIVNLIQGKKHQQLPK